MAYLKNLKIVYIIQPGIDWKLVDYFDPGFNFI
jgi:hypothetical protein